MGIHTLLDRGTHRPAFAFLLALAVWGSGWASPARAQPEPAASADHHLHLSGPELHRVVDAALRAMGSVPRDAPPLPAPTAADAVEALDYAGVRYGLALSAGYIWGSPMLRSPALTALIDSLGLEIGDERERVRAENEYLSEQVARYPERLVGACSVNPLAGYALGEVERCASDPRIRAFKLHLFNSGVDLTSEEDVAGLRAFFQALGETDLAVVVHLGSPISAKAAEDAGVFIRDVLAAAPGVPVQVAHMAGGGPYDDATDAAMQAFVDAFADGTLERDRMTFDLLVFLEDPAEASADTARARAITERNARLADRVREVGLERVVFGTDWPFFPPVGEPHTRIALYREQLRRLLPLEPHELDRVFANLGPVFRTQTDALPLRGNGR